MNVYYFPYHNAGLPGKRAHRGKVQSPLISKRRCPETTAGDSEASTSSMCEIRPTPMTSLFSAPLCEGPSEETPLAGASPGSLYTTEMKNQEVKTKLGLRTVCSLQLSMQLF